MTMEADYYFSNGQAVVKRWMMRLYVSSLPFFGSISFAAPENIGIFRKVGEKGDMVEIEGFFFGSSTREDMWGGKNGERERLQGVFVCLRKGA